MIRSLWTWLQGQMVPDVSDSVTACEFDCRAPVCGRGEWERCAYRRWAQTVGPVARAPRPARPGAGPGRHGDGRRA